MFVAAAENLFTRDIPLFRRVQSGIGANIELYSAPDAIKPYYGNHPLDGNIFIRFRLQSPGEKQYLDKILETCHNGGKFHPYEVYVPSRPGARLAQFCR